MNAVYEVARGLTLLAVLSVGAGIALPGHAQPVVGTMASGADGVSPDLLNEAREAWRLKDRKRLAAASAAAQAQQYPLAPWIDYWDLGLRLNELSPTDLEAFYQRWPGSYVEDRMRNDWLLELGRRRDWTSFARDYPRFKMNDDRELSCYALLIEHQQGVDVRQRALAQWLAQRDGDDGCQLLASTLLEAKRFREADVWLKLRLSFEFNKPRAIKQAAAMFKRGTELDILGLQEQWQRYLARRANSNGRTHSELATLALLRAAAVDPAQAAERASSDWARRLPADLAAWAWAQIARQSAFKLQPEAADYYEHALKLQARAGAAPEWSDDTLAWAARSALRADAGAGRPALLQEALKLMSANEQREPQWQYWRARSLMNSATQGAAGDAQRQQARQLLQALASPLSFYGKLAADELALNLPLPPTPTPLSTAERSAALAHPGLNRGLMMIAMGARSEGVREWNFSLRGMSDRELLAAADLACQREAWDRCINASERTRNEIDLAQRFPMPYRAEVMAKAREIGLDPAYVYGLIRQESRFVTDARSHVGAAGLMQVMPATAKWTAKKAGIAYRPELMTDRDFNLRIGTQYLKLVLDDFGGSMPMAAAAYNAGPNRPRRWREGPLLDAAIWAETIPFNETRDYVKKVLSNATVYARLMGAERATLRERLGQLIGPREASAPQSNQDLP
ncbi:transglycosylase SLT domain-containing protein [Paucibacter sp. APW11]|uniref:Transglycosylase SLT domain-containing protein n=1 Tax=Roseateles aquae TaxID=3077235 RepID=A0ABU3PCR6_9BURK|nr:transglycosylase SLT domain-containing protein [Paucibacter sp. APW11]MDT8999656.1 transglycosylase SLT domain-containing protein [Paucibacter sp. APW11]